MSESDRITVRVAPFVKADLKRLQKEVAEALRRRPPSQDDIVASYKNGEVH